MQLLVRLRQLWREALARRAWRGESGKGSERGAPVALTAAAGGGGAAEGKARWRARRVCHDVRCEAHVESINHRHRARRQRQREVRCATEGEARRRAAEVAVQAQAW